ncbi:MAG: GNAT family N-acetyltransferase [Bacteroidota bacterium]
MNITIRPVVSADLSDVYDLVRELAIYEKALDQLKMTATDYVQYHKEGVFEAIVAEANSKIVGTCIYYLTFSTWKGKMLYLEDFVVTPELRGKRIGEQLFKGFIDIAKSTGCTMVKWQVLDWNEPAIRFYKRHGATIEKEWWNGKIIF